MYLKHIPMDGPKNFRDLGGFLNCDGKAVSWNRLYRSDALAVLSARDEELMRKLNIRTIVDLRSISEQKETPDIVSDGINYSSCPMMREDFSASHSDSVLSFAKSLKVGYLKMIQENADMVANAVKAVIEGLEEGAVVFHCTAGKDRTGVLAAVLLLLLGVSDEDITADYEVSFTYNENGINRMIERIPQIKDYLNECGANSALGSNPQNIKAVLEVINRENIASWLESAGVGADMQKAFLGKMLEEE